MRVALWLPASDTSALLFLSRFVEILSDYGIEPTGVGTEEPDSECVDYIVRFGEGEDEHNTVWLRALTEEEAVRVAVAIGGEKQFETFALRGIAIEDANARLKGLSKRGVHVFARPSRSGVFVRVRYGDRASKVDVDTVEAEIRARFADEIYAEAEIELEEFVIRTLAAGGKRIAVAESFTGGSIASRLTGVAGASSVFYEGVVAYTEQSKSARLGVTAETIAFHTAVSTRAAFEMAKGLLATGKPDVVVSTTGYAGPTGREVGKCFVAVGTAKRINVFGYNFSGTREEITRRGVDAAFSRLADLLLNKLD